MQAVTVVTVQAKFNLTLSTTGCLKRAVTCLKYDHHHLRPFQATQPTVWSQNVMKDNKKSKELFDNRLLDIGWRQIVRAAGSLLDANLIFKGSHDSEGSMIASQA